LTLLGQNTLAMDGGRFVKMLLLLGVFHVEMILGKIPVRLKCKSFFYMVWVSDHRAYSIGL